MAVATIEESIEIIVRESGSTVHGAKLLAAARAGYQVTSVSDAKVKGISITQAYNTIAAACRNGLRGNETASIHYAQTKAFNNETTPIYDADYQATIRQQVQSEIERIESLADTWQNTQKYYQTHHGMTDEFRRLLIKAHGISFRLEDNATQIASKNASAPSSDAPWFQRLKNATYRVVSSEEFWAAIIAGASAISSYAFAHQYYSEHGLGLGSSEDSPLRQLLGHVGGATSYLVYFTLLFYFDLKRIRSMVMQFNVSDVKNSLLRQLKTLLCVEKKYAFQREYIAPVVWFFALFNLLTTFNSPYLSAAHISTPVLREISMTGSFFSALLGNNFVIEKSYAKPLNNLFSDHVLPWWYRRQNQEDKATHIERAAHERAHLQALLSKAKKRVHKRKPDELKKLLGHAGAQLKEDLSRENLFSYLLCLGSIHVEGEKVQLRLVDATPRENKDGYVSLSENPKQAALNYLYWFFTKAGQAAILFGAFYALSTCIRQGQDAIKAIANFLYQNADPHVVFLLGYFAGIPSIAVNMLIGYYAVMYVIDLFRHYRYQDNDASSWFKDAINVIFVTLIAVANTIPAYQVAVDHPEWPGASQLMAVVAFCMSIFSVNNFFTDRHYESSNLFDLIEQSQGDEDVDMVQLKMVLEKEIDAAKDILASTDDDMIRFFYKECTREEDPVAPLQFAHN